MLKKFAKFTIVGVALLAMVGTAQADIEINMFGASAQFNYWETYTPSWLISADVGCPTADVYHARGTADSRDNYIAVCLDDLSLNGGAIVGDGSGGSSVYPNDDIIVRYTTFSSAPGLQAAIGGLTNPDNCPSDTERGMAPIAGTTFTQAVFGSGSNPADCADVPPDGGVTATACTEVNVGCADIGPECFTQSTAGPLHTTTFTDDSDIWCLTGAPTDWSPSVADADWLAPTPPDLTGFDALTQKQPFIVGFSFFRNDTENHGDALGKITNDAGLQYMNNLTRAQAGLLFSGAIAKWATLLDDDDKAGFTDSVMVCIRHAGSGTHATTDWAVMRPFYNLAVNAAHPGSFFVAGGALPAVMTNKGSSDMMRCVGWNGGLDNDRCSELYGAGTPYTSGDHIFTAVGYADWDKLGTTITNDCDSPAEFADVASDPDLISNPSDANKDDKGRAARLCYQGVEANPNNIKNCAYDYWGANVCIYPEGENPGDDLFGKIMDFAGDATQSICGATPIQASEMVCDRADCKSPIRVKP